MKKIILSVVLATLLTFSTAARADSWMGAVMSAINRGNIDSLAAIAAAHPQEQGAMAMFMLQLAHDDLQSNPSVASAVFAATAPLVSQITGPDALTAAHIIVGMSKAVTAPGYGDQNADDASVILAAAVQMSSQPNIVAVAPNAHVFVLLSASTFATNNPTANNPLLSQTVSLAESPSRPPSTSQEGAQTPSAD